MIHTDIWADEGFLELSFLARLLYIGLVTLADDEGRGIANAKSIKARIFAGDDISVKDVEEALEAVCKNTHCEVYEVDGVAYYQLGKWRAYQQISPSHKVASTYPGKTPGPVRKSPGLLRGQPGFTPGNELINELDQLINKEVSAPGAAPGFGESGKAEIAEALESIREGLEEEMEF